MVQSAVANVAGQMSPAEQKVFKEGQPRRWELWGEGGSLKLSLSNINKGVQGKVKSFEFINHAGYCKTKRTPTHIK